MNTCTISEAIEEIRNGRMIILVDNEDRENEGDLVVAAEFCTPEIVNFMVKQARGVLCLAMSSEYCDKLNLQPQVMQTAPKPKDIQARILLPALF